MTGKLCNGVYDQTAVIRNSKAYCEGANYRLSGTAAAKPKTDNPLSKDPEAAASWDAGWDAIDADAGGTVTKGRAPCCGLEGKPVAA